MVCLYWTLGRNVLLMLNLYPVILCHFFSVSSGAQVALALSISSCSPSQQQDCRCKCVSSFTHSQSFQVNYKTPNRVRWHFTFSGMSLSPITVYLIDTEHCTLIVFMYAFDICRFFHTVCCCCFDIYTCKSIYSLIWVKASHITILAYNLYTQCFVYMHNIFMNLVLK